LILENSAGQGVSLATTFREIRKIIDGVDENKRDNIGVCIDTCHIYAYGDYDLSRERDVDRMFRDFEECIGMDKISLIHLNDSKNAMKSRKDRHECLGQGCIWKGCEKSLVYLLERCDRIRVPIVLETDLSDMKVVAGLVKDL
jgi:deoxyribonuclease-4